MRVHHRRCRADDAWRIRGFLRDTFLADAGRSRAWHVARFDYAWWHVLPNVAALGLEQVAWIWEEDDRIVGLAIAEGGLGAFHPSVAPASRGRLEGAMLEVAEAEMAGLDGDGRSHLTVWAGASDGPFSDMLERRGYRRSGVVERRWWGAIDAGDEAATPPTGYEIRALRDGLELLERCYASGLAFHDGDIAVATENRADPSWYLRLQRAPLYRRDLDVVAVDELGAIAGFATAWFDDVTRSVLLEPVGVVPAHQRRGLGRALVTAALARAARQGATLAIVGGYDEAANALYRRCLGDGHDDVEAWTRAW
jgi:mycothiol synthase